MCVKYEDNEHDEDDDHQSVLDWRRKSEQVLKFHCFQRFEAAKYPQKRENKPKRKSVGVHDHVGGKKEGSCLYFELNGGDL